MKKIRPKAISSQKRDFNHMDGARSYIGTKVISKSGDYAGRVFDILLSGTVFEGILVSRRFSKFFIGKEFISSFSGTAVMLGVNPIIMLLGKQVFDSEGKKIGRVSKLIRKGTENKFDALIVRKSFFSKTLRIPKNDISVSKKNILLKKAY